MSNLTPPMDAEGIYTVKQPWSLTPKTIYRCIAIRSFDDLYSLGKDVYTTIYKPMGLIEGEIINGSSERFVFQNEVDARAKIITLLSSDGREIRIPDTYILSYPNNSEFEYQHIVLSVSLGALPYYVDLSDVKSSITDLVLAQFGVTSEVLEHRALTTNQPTNEEHLNFERARLQSISEVETKDEQIIRLTKELEELRVLHQAAINALQANGLLG